MMNLRIAMKEKRCGKLSKRVVLIHNNATPHKPRLIQNLTAEYGWDIFGHSPHSPDLASSDYHLFAYLQHWLGGQRFRNDAEVETGVGEYFSSLEKQHFASGITKLILQYEKCHTKMGNYVEK